MSKRIDWDIVFAILSWAIVVLLVSAATYMWAVPPAQGGPVTDLVGLHGGQIFYSVLFTIQAGMLAYAKLMHKGRMRKKVLLFIYLTGIFTGILAYVLSGFTIRLAIFSLIVLAAAACWLWWTFKTEYIDYDVLKVQVYKDAA